VSHSLDIRLLGIRYSATVLLRFRDKLTTMSVKEFFFVQIGYFEVS